jgi:carboxyl-terminal processing protease
MYPERPVTEDRHRVSPPIDPTADVAADPAMGPEPTVDVAAEGPEPPAAPAPAAPAPATPGRRLPILPIAITLVAIMAGAALFMSGYSMGRQLAVEPGTPVSEDEAFRPFWDTYHTITDRYAGGDVDRATIIQGAIRGMIDALDDPYSSYLSSDEYRQTLQGISGEFEGIGAEIGTKATDGTSGCATLGPDCRLLIIAPIAGSPAEAAGVLAGDLVLAADGVSLDGLTVDGARDRIRGPKGSVVTLSLQRGAGEPFALEITRDVIQQEEVVSKALADDTVGYVKLNEFSDRGADEVEAALRTHVDAGRTAIVLDLRGNPGGYVTAARAVASQFIKSGTLFWEQEADGTQIPTEATGDGVATDPSVRVVCLVDGGSASASEIVAGALQDTKRATLVGQTTFGKGTVQQWQELTGEGGAFRLTVARWLTPDKRWIHDTGIEPDIAVVIPIDVASGDDPVLDRALEVLGEGALIDREVRVAA